MRRLNVTFFRFDLPDLDLDLDLDLGLCDLDLEFFLRLFLFLCVRLFLANLLCLCLWLCLFKLDTDFRPLLDSELFLPPTAVYNCSKRGLLDAT